MSTAAEDQGHVGVRRATREEALAALKKISGKMAAAETGIRPKAAVMPREIPCCVCKVRCLVPFAEPDLRMVICQRCNK